MHTRTQIRKKQNRKKQTIAVLAGVAVAAAVSASAATLGGLGTDHLGANSNDVAAHVENGVAVAWTTAYEPTLNSGSGAYKVATVTLSLIDDAESIDAGSEVKLTLKDDTGALLEELTGVGAGSADIVLTPTTNIAARDVYGVSVVVDGTEVAAADAAID